MPTIKLSKITIPKPKPKSPPVSAPLPGAPEAPAPAPLDPTTPDVGTDTPPVEVDTPTDSTGEDVQTFAANAKHGAAPGSDTDDAEIPSELIDKLYRAVEIVPGLTLGTALTLALQQFLATLPDDYERE